MEPFRGKASGKSEFRGHWTVIQLKRRIEELEAEVAELRRHLWLWHHCKARVNPSGDTLGKERDDG